MNNIPHFIESVLSGNRTIYLPNGIGNPTIDQCEFLKESITPMRPSYGKSYLSFVLREFLQTVDISDPDAVIYGDISDGRLVFKVGRLK